MSKHPLSKSDIVRVMREVADPDERTLLLTELCGNDLALRRAIEEVFGRELPFGSITPQPPSEIRRLEVAETQTAAASTASRAPTVGSGTTIGPYKLVKPIGEGGMGTVWMAEQESPVKRQVALKVIKAGVGSKEIIARFEAERQALALMNHPNIARILDVGTTDQGQPYFAMELVQGMPLTRYCDQNRLGISDRLKLFTEVCSGVQHAHQKGIIHRDLKPGNILVADVDGKPVPKVIDFGLAKALESTQRLTDQSMFTGIGQILGTLKYMSPEQASLDQVDIDTRTDIYALGVILYELLTGSTPLDDESVRGQAVLRVLGLIREQEPVRPSRRLQDTGERLASITNLRRTDSSSLNRILVGDLDWVVVKALEKDRTRRYESAFGLAADIQRFLNNEPVIARPPSVNYRVRKFARKNRGLVIAASALATTLLIGVIGTSWGLREAIAARNSENQRAEMEKKAKEQAIEAKRDAQAANTIAQKRLAQIESGNETLNSIFKGLDIREVREGLEPLEAILAKRLVAVVQQLNSELVGDELVLAKLHTQLGEALTSLGFPDEAVPILERSWEVRKKRLGDDSDDALESGASLSAAFSMAGHFEEAHQLNLALFALTSTRFGPEHDQTLTAIINLADGHTKREEFARVLELLSPVYATLKARQGVADGETVRCAQLVAAALIENGEHAKAREILEAVVPFAAQVFGPNNPDVISIKQNLAATYARQGQAEQALPLMEEILELRRERQGADHPDTLLAMVNAALAHGEVGHLDKKVAMMEETLPRLRQKRGTSHPDTLAAANFLVEAYNFSRQPQKAVALIRETLEAAEFGLDPAHPQNLALKSNLAMCHWSLGEYDRAIQLYQELLPLTERQFTRSHPNTLVIVGNLGVNLKDAGRPGEAISLLEEIHSALLAPPQLRRICLEALLACYFETNNLERSRQLAGEFVNEARTSHLPGSLPLAGTLLSVGKILLEHKQSVDATPLLRECLTISQEHRPDHWVTFATQTLLGEALADQHLFAEAERQLLDGYEGLVAQQANIPTHAPPETQPPAARRRIATLYETWADAEPNQGYDRKAAEWRQKQNEP